MRYFTVGAGSNIGFIRNPLGDFDDPLTVPRLVAATNPVLNGFADDIAISANGLALVPMQTPDRVFAYDIFTMLSKIEFAANADPIDAFANNSQYQDVPDDLTALVRGPLGTIPIDLMYPSAVVQADFRFFEGEGENVNGILIQGTGYGVPPTDPFGRTPNLAAPIETGNLPRGISVIPVQQPREIQLVDSPYTQAPSLQSFPNESQTVETGRTTVAEIHSGALHESHSFVTYHSQGRKSRCDLAL